MNEAGAVEHEKEGDTIKVTTVEQVFPDDTYLLPG